MSARPFLGLHCVDCGVGTFTLGEYYMVEDGVWELAWAGRRKSWHRFVGEILCICWRDKRIGRKLQKSDFPACPVNDPNDVFHGPEMSARLLDRLGAAP